MSIRWTSAELGRKLYEQCSAAFGVYWRLYSVWKSPGYFPLPRLSFISNYGTEAGGIRCADYTDFLAKLIW